MNVERNSSLGWLKWHVKQRAFFHYLYKAFADRNILICSSRKIALKDRYYDGIWSAEIDSVFRDHGGSYEHGEDTNMLLKFYIVLTYSTYVSLFNIYNYKNITYISNTQYCNDHIYTYIIYRSNVPTIHVSKSYQIRIPITCKKCFFFKF